MKLIILSGLARAPSQYRMAVSHLYLASELRTARHKLAQEARVPPTHTYTSQSMPLTDGQFPPQMWLCHSSVNGTQRFFLWNLCPEVTCWGTHSKCRIYWLNPALGLVEPLFKGDNTFILNENRNVGKAL